ncbi:unnamed protein product (macronuclear) [Paramecium tetraurelia]|uniref:Uncharacterized protein n=1 Tax=Paramecium tetraurelia TaxID=5888 RepID=A0CJ72_PARTE|nr:uncharacterized protein GSPATT00038621001 [Paramecium tetraurelia]CAK70839.1 unnamed protein product [Paramecium tetraurelia]|eukprot:XP_001438236.1 hypothetical protein (macronuclear) [Paramecium tetraurelia strain d4-2]
MQRQQQQQQLQQIYIPTFEEKQQILQRLILLLINKQRKPKDSFDQKNDEEETNFDTILDGIENNSHISKISSDNCSSYIQINISNYEAQILKCLLDSFQKDIQSQISCYEKNAKGQSDIQNQQISYVIEPRENFKSDVIKPNQFQNSDEEINTQKKKKKKNPKAKIEKFLNEQQILLSLKNMRHEYNKRLEYLKEIKQANKSLENIMRLKDKTPKYRIYEKENKDNLIILLECTKIINEIQQTFQQQDYEMEGLGK